ncbi:MAG: hypothetical protein QOJ40_1026 [Verrucomicrobiota bacterium]
MPDVVPGGDGPVFQWDRIPGGTAPMLLRLRHAKAGSAAEAAGLVLLDGRVPVLPAWAVEVDADVRPVPRPVWVLRLGPSALKLPGTAPNAMRIMLLLELGVHD